MVDERTSKQRAAYYREEAAIARAKAEQMTDPHLQEKMMRLAQVWEQLADAEEMK